MDIQKQLQIAWAAGILEGEGCFTIFVRKDRRSTASIAIHCEMTDEDTIRKLASVFEVGAVLLRPNTNGRRDTRTRKPTWIWSVQNKTGIKLVINNVMPYLGIRRSAKAQELLDYIEHADS